MTSIFDLGKGGWKKSNDDIRKKATEKRKYEYKSDM
jgi:hypothetical protein